jgi:hypothetical protein
MTVTGRMIADGLATEGRSVGVPEHQLDGES